MKKHVLTAYPMNSYMWGYVNYYKSVHQPFPAHENWEHPGNFQNESVSSACNEFCLLTL